MFIKRKRIPEGMPGSLVPSGHAGVWAQRRTGVTQRFAPPPTLAASSLPASLGHDKPNENQQADHHGLVYGDPKSRSPFQPKITVLDGAELPDQPPKDPLVKLVVLFLAGQLLLVGHPGGVDAAGDKLLLGHVGLGTAIVVDPIRELPVVGLVVPVALSAKVDIKLSALPYEGPRADLSLARLGDLGGTGQSLPVPLDPVLYASCLDC